MASVYKSTGYPPGPDRRRKDTSFKIGNDHDFVVRFRQEAQAAAKLSHPNIVNIYDVGYDENVHYIVMEFVRGETLKEYIEKHGHLPINTSIQIAFDIGEALEMPMPTASSTAISSPIIFWSPKQGASKSPTSVSPGPSIPSKTATARSWVLSIIFHRNRPAAAISTNGRISTPWVSSCMK